MRSTLLFQYSGHPLLPMGLLLLRTSKQSIQPHHPDQAQAALQTPLPPHPSSPLPLPLCTSHTHSHTPPQPKYRSLSKGFPHVWYRQDHTNSQSLPKVTILGLHEHSSSKFHRIKGNFSSLLTPTGPGLCAPCDASLNACPFKCTKWQQQSLLFLAAQ